MRNGAELCFPHQYISVSGTANAIGFESLCVQPPSDISQALLHLTHSQQHSHHSQHSDRNHSFGFCSIAGSESMPQSYLMHLQMSSINLTILLKPGEFFRLFRISIRLRFSSSCSVLMWFSLMVSSCTYVPKCSIVFSPSVK